MFDVRKNAEKFKKKEQRNKGVKEKKQNKNSQLKLCYDAHFNIGI